MSYKVIVVEDEKITLEELIVSIPWKELGLEVIATAEDGIAGEKLIKDLKPDIVVTDIRLPGQDGLNMLSHAPGPFAIILSGHTDFAYAKKAIQLGVINYMEKPIDNEELITTLNKAIERIEENTEATEEEDLFPLPQSCQNHNINMAIEYIKEHYAEAIGLSDVAEFTRMSENHLSALFRDESGINFLQYLNSYRLNKAAKLLKNTTLNISEVADSCGFPTPSYFTKIFRKYTEKSPREFREGDSSK